MKVLILAGGSGTRLWPLSRSEHPKQFIKLSNDKSLFQITFLRSLQLTNLSNIFIVTNQKYKYLVMGEVNELGYYNYDENNIIVEPESKNTLPAIYAGIHVLQKMGNDTVVVFPSDHVILNSEKLIDIIKESIKLTKNTIVTFGIKPDNPNTGYGYISPGSPIENGYIVKEFKEKPNYDTAKKYVQLGYLWNSGIFLFRSELFIEEVKKYTPDIFYSFQNTSDIEEAFQKISSSVSIDNGILEKSKKISVVPSDITWSDVGSFETFHKNFPKDLNNNVINTEAIVIESKNNFIYSDTDNKLIAAIGVEDLVVVDNKDALLVCKKDQSQSVKKVVEKLKINNDNRLHSHNHRYKPWGYYEVLLDEVEGFRVNRLKINSGKKISYQYHNYRSEHWVIVKGNAKIVIEDIERTLSAGESIFIKPGQKHSIENPYKHPLEVIEIQVGNPLTEDDIIRTD